MKPMSSVLPASLLPLAMAGVLTLSASGPAAADVYAFGNTAHVGSQSLIVGSHTISTAGNQGWVGRDGSSHNAGGAGNTNYFVGSCSTCKTNEHNNYFVFSLAGLTSPVSSATLSLAAGMVVGSGTYFIYDATSLADSLLAGPTSPNATLYNELATSGPLIGEIDFNSSESDGMFRIALNAAGLADLNFDITHGIPDFAIGGSLSPPDSVSVPAPLPGVGLLQCLSVLGLLTFAATRARFRA